MPSGSVGVAIMVVARLGRPSTVHAMVAHVGVSMRAGLSSPVARRRASAYAASSSGPCLFFSASVASRSHSRLSTSRVSRASFRRSCWTITFRRPSARFSHAIWRSSSAVLLARAGPASSVVVGLWFTVTALSCSWCLLAVSAPSALVGRAGCSRYPLSALVGPWAAPRLVVSSVRCSYGAGRHDRCLVRRSRRCAALVLPGRILFLVRLLRRAWLGLCSLRPTRWAAHEAPVRRGGVIRQNGMSSS